MLFAQAITILLSAAVHAAEDVNQHASPSGLRHSKTQSIENINHLDLRVLQTDDEEDDDDPNECVDDSTTPGPTSAPTPEPRACFGADGSDLKAAVKSYVENGGDSSSEIAQTYGWPIGEWCVDKVENFSWLFSGLDFNEDISTWNTSSATDLSVMFYRTEKFNQDITGWDVSNVVTTNSMFSEAKAFNQDLSVWDTPKLINTGYMFNKASSFRQNLCPWGESTKTASTNVVGNMFSSSACPVTSDPSPNGLGPYCFSC